MLFFILFETHNINGFNPFCCLFGSKILTVPKCQAWWKLR